MATQSWSTRVRHDSDAVFREWGSELSARLAAVGLIQTADTGQINWTTVLRPAANTDAGYEIWRFNDAQQGAAPIFIRIAYGTSTAVTSPRIRIQTGTATDGAGNLSGVGGAITNVGAGATSAIDTPRQSWLCYVDGFLGLYWKRGFGGEAFFAIARTVDAAGVADARGSIQNWSSGSSNTINRRQALRFASPSVAYAPTSSDSAGTMGFIPQAPVQSLAGSLDLQVAIAWTIIPQVTPIVGMCGVYQSELAIGGTFSATPVGTTARTYITLPNEAGPFGPVAPGVAGGINIAMLWE